MVQRYSKNHQCVRRSRAEAPIRSFEFQPPIAGRQRPFHSRRIHSLNSGVYGDMSARVMSVLSGFTPDLEIYSIDEAFLGMAGFRDRLEAQARALRAAVCCIPISIGIAPTKTLAKLANHAAKKDQKHGGALLLLDEVAQDAALARIELTDSAGPAF